VRLSLEQDLDSQGSLALEDHARDQSIRQDGQVLPVQVGVDIGPKEGEPLALAYPHIGQRAAAFSLHHRAVLVSERRDADGACGLQHRRRDRSGSRHGLDEYEPARPEAFRVRLTMPVLDAPVNCQDGVVAPGRITRLGGEVVPVVLVALRPDHHVDA